MFYLHTCFKKLICSPSFWAGIIGTMIICMFSSLYDNPITNTSESIIYVFCNYRKETMLQDIQFSSYSVFIKGLGGWLGLFAPVLVSMASVNIKIDEQNTGIWRFIKSRTDYMNYNISVCIFYIISGGMILSSGYLLFGICIYFMFPHLSSYSVEEVSLYLDILFQDKSIMKYIFNFGGFNFTITAHLFEVFLYGTLCNLISLILSSFVENKYVIICTPFFLKYTLNRISTNLISIAYSDLENPNETLGNLANIINPESLTTVFFYPQNSKEIIVLYIILVFISISLFCLICKRREKYAS